MGASQHIDTRRGAAQVGELIERAKRFRGRRWRADAAKIFVDGDWPSPSMNPLEAIQIAITRRPPGGGPEWLPQERAGLAAMLAAYTIAAAWLAREDEINGSVEIGKTADLIVLERNLFDVDPMEIRNVRVLLTLLDGEPVYRDPQFAWPGHEEE